MAVKKKTINYRVNGCACLPGYVLIGDCNDNNVYDMDGVVVPGAVITAAGDCPQEVVVVCDNKPDVCTPTISSAPGDTLAGLLPGTSISVQKNSCCAIKVSTSAGDFIVSKEVTGYSTGDFKCDVTVTGVEVLSGTCSLSDVIVTTQRAG